MLVELNEKETTACAFLRVLRGRLTRSINNKEDLSTRELRKMVDEGISRISKKEMSIVDMYLAREDNIVKFVDPVVEKKVLSSSIDRLDYEYRKVLGMSISRYVKESFCEKGISVEDATRIMLRSKEVKEIIKLSENAGWKKEKVIENIKTSIHSRYTDDRNFGNKR